MSSTLTITCFDSTQIQTHRAQFIALLRDAVENGASINFIAPLAVNDAYLYWDKVAKDVTRHERIVIAALSGRRLIGSAQLALAMQPNGRHRAEVQKVIVLSEFRRRGIGKLLLRALEDEARRAGRTLLVLDTERGSGAERLYEQMGYQRAGIIPGFAYNHDGTELVDAVLFYRELS